MPKPSTLPEVLSQDEVVRFLEAVSSLKCRVALTTAYATGKRVSEVVGVEVRNIDSGRMVIRVEHGKGGKDRYVMLSTQLLREVDGIGPVRAKGIVTAWAEQKVVREIMVFLHSHGVGTARAVRIFKTYGVDAIQIMSENPIAWRATSAASASRRRTRSR